MKRQQHSHSGKLSLAGSGRLGWTLATLALVILFALGGSVAAQTVTLPAEPPDAVAGLATHAERCANCHGVTGQGDGELAANLPNPPAAHASLEYLRAAVPAQMFDVITNGKVPQGMPPFGPESSNPLEDNQRWELIAAIFSLGTPIASVEQGQMVYEENCLACHGETGQGDGPDAAALDVQPGDIGSADYWFNISNQTVFDNLSGSTLADHDYDLAEEDLWSAIDYMRTFSYGYTDALAQFRPLETARINGQLFNGTTSEPVASGPEVLLRAFTRDLDITLTMTETVDVDGTFQFDLTDVPQEWFFRVSTSYNDVDFGSDFGQVTFDQSELDLPITVYEPSADPAAVNIQQLHVVLVFDQNQAIVSELYLANNNDETVFVGETGDAAEGTFKFSLPATAENVNFQRGFGSIDSYIPATEVIETDSGWADTLPLRPGPSSMNMLVQYTLPYEDQATFSHSLNYPTESVNLVIPDVGVSLDESNGWVSGGTQAMEGGTITTYGQSSLPAGSELTFNLEGEARASSASVGNLVTNNTTELLVGIGVALVVLIGAAVVIRQWRQEPVVELSREELIQAIAELDDEYEAGKIDEAEYERERAALKADLRAIWEAEEDGE